jgi:kynurenine formamidase
VTDRRRIVELSHPIRHGMQTYPGLPGPEISDHMSRCASRAKYPPGTEFQIGRITLVANTGTYLDAPFHRYPDGPDLSMLDLTRLADVSGVLIEASTAAAGLGPDLFAGRCLTDRAVLIRTGWDQHWGSTRYEAAEHPYLTAAAVAWLVSQRPAVVGIDSVNIDDMADLARPAHTELLAARIPIVEHLCGLDQLPIDGLVGMGSFPVRAYAVLD